MYGHLPLYRVACGRNVYFYFVVFVSRVCFCFRGRSPLPRSAARARVQKPPSLVLPLKTYLHSLTLSFLSAPLPPPPRLLLLRTLFAKLLLLRRRPGACGRGEPVRFLGRGLGAVRVDAEGTARAVEAVNFGVARMLQ